MTPQTLKGRITTGPSDSTPRNIPKGPESRIQTGVCTHVTAALFTAATGRKGPWPSTVTDTQNLVCPYNAMLSLKKEGNSDRRHSTTQRDLESTMLSEMKWMQKDKYCTIPLGRNTQNRQVTETEISTEVTGVRGQLVFKGYRVPVRGDERVWDIHSDDRYTALCMLLIHLQVAKIINVMLYMFYHNF